MRWLCATVAPWALGAGLVVSFTATAGVNLDVGQSIETPSPLARALDEPGLVAPLPRDRLGRLAERIDAAGLGFSEPVHASPFAALDPGLAPRDERKSGSDARAPLPSRAGRGDAAGRVPISLSRLGHGLGEGGLAPSLLAPSETWLPPAPILHGEALPLEVGVAGTFEPTFDFDAAAQIATTERTPEAIAQGSSGIGIAHGAPGEEGGTPLVGRAASLATATPPSAWSPVVVAAAPVTMRIAAAVALGIGPNYLSLIDRGRMARERRCLAEAVYFESRSEPEAGQAAVAQVVLNRVKSRLYPNTICGVVYQNRHRHLACQFTFACEGRALRINEPAAWRRAQRIADSVLEGETFLASVGLATHYHADYVNPRWASRLIHKDTIGRHIFYQLHPGQR